MAKLKFHDVSGALQKLREFLLGRRHNLHARFPHLVAPRSIPPPDIPRAPEYKYSDQYYHSRHIMNSVKPPVVAPVAQGPPPNLPPTQKAYPGGMRPESVCFSSVPTPGPPWWWDGHCYFEYVKPPCPPPQQSPRSQPVPPCPPSPDKRV